MEFLQQNLLSIVISWDGSGVAARRSCPKFREPAMISSNDDDDKVTRVSKQRTWYLAAGQGLTAAVLIVLTALVWKGIVQIERLADQISADQHSRERFYEKLVVGIQGLAEQSGMLTSADHSPVRFRIRFKNGLSFPQSQMTGALFTQQGEPLIELRNSPPHSGNGTLHFGLQRPGQYRLKLTVYDTYVLEHEFDVLPGVPVDRVVECPHQDAPLVSISMTVNSPACLQAHRLLVLCHVARDSIAVGDWIWQPMKPQTITVAAASGSTDADRWTEYLTGPGKLDVSPTAVIPFARCRLTGMTIFALDGSLTNPPVELGTYRYSHAGEISSNENAESQVTALDEPAPTFSVDPLNRPDNQNWSIPLPAAARLALEKRLCDTSVQFGT